MTEQILKALTALVEPIRLDAKIRKETTMHYQMETGLRGVTLASPSMVQISDPNQDQDTIPACITCGTTRIEEIGYSEGLPVWECARGHRSDEVDEAAVMPNYVADALDELAACWGPYDWPGDTMRDEGRAA
jgi:hypothetical protein